MQFSGRKVAFALSGAGAIGHLWAKIFLQDLGLDKAFFDLIRKAWPIKRQLDQLISSKLKTCCVRPCKEDKNSRYSLGENNCNSHIQQKTRI